MEQIKKAYIKNPLSLSTAYWKVEKWQRQADKHTIKHKEYIIFNRQLMHFNDLVDQEVLNQLDGIDTDVKQRLEGFDENQYFKLYHPMDHVDHVSHDYQIRVVRPDEYDQVVQFINDAYEHINVDLKYVNSWTQHHVYDKSLWIWIIDREEKLALGIAEYDPHIREGALEWIQVKAGQRGKGLGKILVLELLHRMPQAAFVTVAGEVFNQSNPDKLYRTCGFIGDKIWYHYKRRRL